MRIIQIADACVCCGSTTLASSPAVLMPFLAQRAYGISPVEITAAWEMRDLKQGTSYMPCQSLQCQACGLLFLNYRFTDAQLAAIYRGYRDDDYNRERERFEPGYATTGASVFLQRNPYIAGIEEWLEPHLGDHPVVLDWGGGDGTNSPFLGRATVYVHDISGVALVDGALPASLRSESVPIPDLVTCSNVLEHVPSPMAVLNEILPVMGAGTLLYLEVPHEVLIHEHPGSLGLAPLKLHWHEHINFFTPDSLAKLVANAGLSVVASHSRSVELGDRGCEVQGLLARRA